MNDSNQQVSLDQQVDMASGDQQVSLDQQVNQASGAGDCTDSSGILASDDNQASGDSMGNQGIQASDVSMASEAGDCQVDMASGDGDCMGSMDSTDSTDSLDSGDFMAPGDGAAVDKRENPDRRRKVKELYDEGLFDSEIAEKLGVTRRTVIYHRRKMGLSSLRPPICQVIPPNHKFEGKLYKHKIDYLDGDDSGVTMELTCGLTAVLDRADLPKIKQFRWFTTKGGQIVARVDGAQMPMVRCIRGLEPQGTRAIVHIDEDPKNCRRSNLKLLQLSPVKNGRLPAGMVCKKKGEQLEVKAQLFDGSLISLGERPATDAGAKDALIVFGLFASWANPDWDLPSVDWVAEARSRNLTEGLLKLFVKPFCFGRWLRRQDSLLGQ